MRRPRPTQGCRADDDDDYDDEGIHISEIYGRMTQPEEIVLNGGAGGGGRPGRPTTVKCVEVKRSRSTKCPR